MKVDVGQLLFVLNSSTRSLMPAQVDEVVVSKTMRGETVQHVLMLTNGKKLILEKLGSPWFRELSDAKAYLLSEAEKMIDVVVDSAKEESEKHFDVPSLVLEPGYGLKPDSPNPQEQHTQQLTVDLGDGRKARVSIPEELSIENTAG